VINSANLNIKDYFSYIKDYFPYIVMVTGFSALPAVCLAYLRYRLPARREQLTSLFKSEYILPAYLATRGHGLLQGAAEIEEAYRARLVKEFDKVFSSELGQEYGLTLYAIPLIAACLTTMIVIFFLVGEAIGKPVMTGVPLPVSFALLGGFAGSLYDVISRYSRTDLNPTSLWWIPFRYLMAIAYGLFASMIFSATFAGLGSFMLGTISVTAALDFARSRIGLSSQESQSSGFQLIQGLDAATIATLADLGVTHAQHLAFGDPLRLLLRSNFSSNQLADWMDQSFLFNYVGQKIDTLRSAGIRGAIEIMDIGDLEDEKKGAMIAAVAERLEITTSEVNNLIEEFSADAQLALIWKIWGTGEPDDEDET
jgi:hypothetical protein